MYLPDFLRGLLRRWYVVILGLAATAGICVMAMGSLPRTYDAQGSLLLLPPKNSVGAKGNPYLYLGGLAQALDVLSARVSSDPVRRPLEDRYPSATYAIGPDRSTTGPILLVTSTGPSPGVTMSLLEAALTATPRTLTALQDELGIQEPARITVMRLSVDDEPTLDTKARMKVLLALAGAGVAGTVLGTALLDRLLRARLQRRGRSAVTAPGSPEAKTAESPAPAGPEPSQPDDPGPPTGSGSPATATVESEPAPRPVSEHVGRR